jgi:hypothetical protein
LFKAHRDLDKKEHALEEAFHAGDIGAAKKAFALFEDANEAHLKKEEDIMMPKVMEMKKSGKNLKALMQQEIFPIAAQHPDFEFFIKYANEVLERHPGGMPRVRVWDLAVWAAASTEEWKQIDKWIKETLSEATYKEVQDAING